MSEQDLVKINDEGPAPEFEPDFERKEEKDPIRPFLWIGGAAIVLIVAFLWMLLSINNNDPAKSLENIAHAGSADFDAYKNKLEFEYIDKMVYPTMMGLWQLEVKARMHNRGDRPLTGVEVVGKMIDLNDKVIAQATSVPIPRIRTEPLKPGESFVITLKVDAPSKIKEDDVKDIVLEVRGLRF
ncbi:MAG: hypothetical protein J2P41_15270 [Blastocatellia bacterium]|nr:hypothetical protein [Blastocatellia bacterium]